MHVDLLAIAYLSTAVKWPTRSQLEILLLDARDFNERVGVTGALLLHDLTFFQYFEGPESAVQEVYARIKRSRLHHSIFELFNEPIERRHFSRWTMGFAEAQPGDLLGSSQAQWRELIDAESPPFAPVGVDLLLDFWKNSARTRMS